MVGLTLAWEYLTGYAVATDPTNRDRAEWPPHPARVYLALAAAWYETGEVADEGAALRWLESLGDPSIRIPYRESVFERTLVTQYVPVNDKAGPSAATLQCAPALTRSKQPRTSPRVWVGAATCSLHWDEAPDLASHVEALSRLCERVTRIGHSSSLVRIWLTETDESAVDAHDELLPAGVGLGTTFLRSVTPGLLDTLSIQTQIPRIRRFDELAQQIERGDAKAVRAAKAEYKDEFREKWRASSKPPILGRPAVYTATAYARATGVPVEAVHSYFDPDMLVLRRMGGPQLPASAVLAATAVLRKAVMESSGEQPASHWVSGHQADGAVLLGESGHVAFVPLPFVGPKHGDGSLKGLAIVFPRAWGDLKERGRAVGPLLVGSDGRPREVALTLGALGIMLLHKTDWSERGWSLQSETWTAISEGATVWASATPVVLDRFPKADRTAERTKWNAEVAEIVASACERIGLPKPVEVDIDSTSWLRGAPRAITKRRRLRGHDGLHQQSSPMGDGYPSYPAKGGVSRPQVHVRVRFGEPVIGPILLGAGRFLGYGLCQPVEKCAL